MLNQARVLVVGVVLAAVVLPASSAGAVAGYGDVADDRFFTEPVQWSVDGGITGLHGACFEPDRLVSRGEMAVWLWNMEGQPSAPAHGFVDVADPGQQQPVSWLLDREITTGTSDTTFSPDNGLTRGQFAAFLWRLAGRPSARAHSFVDVLSSWQQGPVSWLVEQAITTGTSATTFSPDNGLTRGQLVTFLYRYKGEPTVMVDPASPECDPDAPLPPVVTDQPDTATFKTVDGGGWHSCRLRADDTITCWGYNRYGQSDAPSGTFKTVSAGGWHSCGLRADDTITCWGYNDHGESDAPSGAFKTVSAGRLHSCGLRADDTITCWGDNTSGQSDAPSGAFKTVDGGGWHSCGLRADDTITCWGYNDHGQSDAPSGAFKTVSAGRLHSCGLRADDTITCWGDNTSGQSDAPSGAFKTVSAGGGHSCGLRADDTITCWGHDEWGQSDAPSGAFKTVSAGGLHSCGLRADDTITCWGYNEWGQSDAPSGAFKTVSAGGLHSCGLRADDTITCWGHDQWGQSDAPSGAFKTVSAGHFHSCGLRADDTITCWGNNTSGQIDAPSGTFKTVSAGHWHSCGLRADDTITCWGWNNHGQADAPSGAFKTVSAGGWHSCGLRADDTITCWGYNDHGESDAPSGAFKTVSAGRLHSCGLRADDTITCWGHDQWGQSDAPSGTFKTVSGGHFHSCGLRADDTITCWGDNERGQIDAPSGAFKTVSAGGFHSCGLRADDTITCWSNNGNGQSDASSGTASSEQATDQPEVTTITVPTEAPEGNCAAEISKGVYQWETCAWISFREDPDYHWSLSNREAETLIQQIWDEVDVEGKPSRPPTSALVPAGSSCASVTETGFIIGCYQHGENHIRRLDSFNDTLLHEVAHALVSGHPSLLSCSAATTNDMYQACVHNDIFRCVADYLYTRYAGIPAAGVCGTAPADSGDSSDSNTSTSSSEWSRYRNDDGELVSNVDAEYHDREYPYEDTWASLGVICRADGDVEVGFAVESGYLAGQSLHDNRIPVTHVFLPYELDDWETYFIDHSIESYWSESADNRAAFLPDEFTEDFVNSATAPGVVALIVTNFDGSSFGLFGFDMRGSYEHIRAVTEECGWTWN